MEERTLSVISFNAFGSPFNAYRVLTTVFTTHVYKRLAYLSAELNSSDADVICLQEVNTYPQLFYLKSRLVNFPYVYYRHYLQGPRGGLVIFSKLPFETLSYITFEKKGSLHGKSFIAYLLKRGLLIGQLKGMPLTVVNTHLTQNLAHDWSESSALHSLYTSQLTQITNYILDNKLTNRSVILTGDFNVPKNTDLFEKFLEKAMLEDVFHEHTKSTYHEEYHLKDVPLGRVDHIFLFQNAAEIDILEKKHLFEKKVMLSNGEEHYLSDHIGLYAKFRISI